MQWSQDGPGGLEVVIDFFCSSERSLNKNLRETVGLEK